MRDFFVALGLVLVIEGLLLAAFPGRLREALEAIKDLADSSLRNYGLGAAVVGLGFVWLVRASGIF